MDLQELRWSKVCAREDNYLNCPEVIHWDGDIFFLCGGYITSNTMTNRTQFMNVKTLETFELAPMNIPRSGH